MSIRLDLYKIFDKVAKCKSFSKAAGELYMTQPAVSQAIIQLENELKLRLFTRTPRGVVLTKEGHILFEYTNSAISLLDMGERKIREVNDLEGGELRIGVSDTIARYYLLSYLEKFYKDYPNIKLRIINRTTEELCNLIKTGGIDIGICNLPMDDNSLEIEECYNIHDIFVGNKNYKDLVGREISFSELLSHPLILLDNRSRSRKYVEDYFLSKGIKIMPEIELGSHDLLLEFAKIGLGIACVVKEFSKDYLGKDLYEIKLEEKIPRRGIGICTLKGVTLSPASKRFVEYLVK